MLVTSFLVHFSLYTATHLIKFTQAEHFRVFAENLSKCSVTGKDWLDNDLKIERGRNGSNIIPVIMNSDLLDTTTIYFKILKKTSNSGVWQPHPFHLPELNICAFINVDTVFYPSVVQYTNFPARCPFRKGSYYINGTEWTGQCPLMLALPGCYKVVLYVKDKGETHVCVAIVAKLALMNGSRFPRCT